MKTVGLAMIVRNEEKMLRACLTSVRAVVSQMVVVDTGSSDDTGAVARSCGATVISHPWQNHFAEARNAALNAMETDWVLSLDADEELDSEAVQSMPQLLEAAPRVGGYLTPIRNYVPVLHGRGWDRTTKVNDHRHLRAHSAPGYFVHENCRLFRRNPDIYFIGRVHEVVEPQIQKLRLELAAASFCIHHFGQLERRDAAPEKAAQYRQLLRLKVQEQPNDPSAWVQLGLEEYEGARNSGEALRCLERAIALEPRAEQAWFFVGMIRLEQGENEAALGAFDRVRGHAHNQALLAQFRGDALHNLGQLRNARDAYCHALDLTPDDPIVLSKLGYSEVRLGQATAGFARLRQASQAAPQVAEIRERLMKACIATNDLLEAAVQAEKIAELEATPKWYLRAASIRLRLQQGDQAKEVLRRGTILFPEAAELTGALSELEAGAR
jgi:tetratricopeptide (TPR) repeat protein